MSLNNSNFQGLQVTIKNNDLGFNVLCNGRVSCETEMIIVVINNNMNTNGDDCYIL